MGRKCIRGGAIITMVAFSVWLKKKIFCFACENLFLTSVFIYSKWWAEMAAVTTRGVVKSLAENPDWINCPLLQLPTPQVVPYSHGHTVTTP